MTSSLPIISVCMISRYGYFLVNASHLEPRWLFITDASYFRSNDAPKQSHMIGRNVHLRTVVKEPPGGILWSTSTAAQRVLSFEGCGTRCSVSNLSRLPMCMHPSDTHTYSSVIHIFSERYLFLLRPAWTDIYSGVYVLQNGTCSRGDVCTYSHGVFECWLHPSKYKTQVRQGPTRSIPCTSTCLKCTRAYSRALFACYSLHSLFFHVRFIFSVKYIHDYRPYLLSFAFHNQFNARAPKRVAVRSYETWAAATATCFGCRNCSFVIYLLSLCCLLFCLLLFLHRVVSSRRHAQSSLFRYVPNTCQMF